MNSIKKNSLYYRYGTVLLLSALVVLILSTSVFAKVSETEYLYSGDSYLFEGHNVYILLSSHSVDTLQVQIDGDPLFVSMPFDRPEYEDYKLDGAVLSTSLVARSGDVIVEITEICFDVSEDDCGRVNELTKQVDPSFRLEMSLSAPDLEVTRTYSKNTVFIGEEVEVVTTIENTGDVLLRNIDFEEVYPESVTVRPSSQYSVVNNKLSYIVPSLSEGDSQSFTSKLYLDAPLEYSLKGKATYTYDSEFYEVFSESTELELANILDVSLDIPYNDIEVGDSITAEIIIENVADDDVTYNTSFIIPGGLRARNLPVLAGTIREGDIVEKEFTLDVVADGEYTVFANVDSTFILQNPTIVKSVIVKTNVDDDSRTMAVTIRPKDEDILEGETSSLEVHFVAPEIGHIEDIDATFYAVVGDSIKEINTSNGILRITNLEFSIDRFDTDFTNYVIPLSFLDINETISVDLYVVGNYTSVLSNGSRSRYAFETEKSVNVYILEDAVTVEHDLSPSTIEQGEFGTMQVRITNNLQRRKFTSMRAYDVIPPEFINKSIKSDTYLDLEPRVTKTAYTYELRAPYFVQNASNITTYLEFLGVTLISKSDIASKVDLKEPDVRVSFSFQDEMRVGNRVRLGMTVANTGTVPAKNIVVRLPFFEGLDALASSVDDLVYVHTVDFLDPGESVEVFYDYRPKFEGMWDSPASTLYLRDEFGNSFSSSLSSTSGTVESGALTCYVLGTKRGTFGENISTTRNAEFSLVLQNKCDIAATVTISGFSSQVYLAPFESKTIIISESFLESTTKVMGSRFSYWFDSEVPFAAPFGVNQVYVTKTNDVETNIIVQETILDTSSTNNASGSSAPTVVISTPRVPENAIALDTTEVSLIRRFIGLFIGIFVVIFLMVVILKARVYIQKAYAQKKVSEESVSLNSAPKHHVTAVRHYVDIARQNNIPANTIRENLLKAGWDTHLVEHVLK